MRRALALLAIVTGGCSVGQGKGSVAGTLYVAQCETLDGVTSSYPAGATAAGAFDLKPTFFVAQPTDDQPKSNPMNRVMIRVQSGGNRLNEADALLVNVADVRLLALSIGQPGVVGPATNVRATLALNQTCTAHQVALELDGAITFTKLGSASAGRTPSADFSIGYGDELTASFSLDVIDRRAIVLGGQAGVPTAPQAGGHLDGNFDFTVVASTIAQAYP